MQVYTNLDTHWGTLDGGSVQRVRHEWHSGHRLSLAHSGCILHTGTHTCVHTTSCTLISLQLSPAAHTICLGLEEAALKWLYSSSQALNIRTWKLHNLLAIKWQE